MPLLIFDCRDTLNTHCKSMSVTEVMANRGQNPGEISLMPSDLWSMGFTQSKECTKRPLLSLGSNQVDLGGMTSPASATAISC